MTVIWIGAAITVVLGLAGWVLRYMVNGNNEKHKLHFKHAADADLHQTANERKALLALMEEKLASHEKLDTERFSSIEKKLDEMAADLKQLLKMRDSARGE